METINPRPLELAGDLSEKGFELAAAHLLIDVGRDNSKLQFTSGRPRSLDRLQQIKMAACFGVDLMQVLSPLAEVLQTKRVNSLEQVSTRSLFLRSLIQAVLQTDRVN